VNDVIVIGAGPAGAAYALSLARQGRNVLVIGMPPGHHANTLELLDGRASRALERLELLDAVAATATPCDGVISCWGETVEIRSALTDPDGGGWIVDRIRFDQLMLNAAVAHGAVWLQARVLAVGMTDETWQVDVRQARHEARALVLAIGRNSSLAARAGGVHKIDHRAVALVGWLDPIHELGNRLFVGAGPAGWWFALGTECGVSLGYVTDCDLLPRGTNRTAAAWKSGLEALGYSPSAGVRVIARPATTGRLELSAPHAMVIGDAALAIDPLSGYGLTLALESALQAAEDPQVLPQWLAATATLHAQQERMAYDRLDRDHRSSFFDRGR